MISWFEVVIGVAGAAFGAAIALLATFILRRIGRASMPPWTSGNLIVYHGTDSHALASYGTIARNAVLNRFTVNLPLCRPATDFGQGFYTTTSLHQAKEWANSKVRRVTAGGGTTAGVVLQFELDRTWLASQETLVFVRAINDYWDFVTHCRAGLPVHNRPLPRSPNDPFDVVYGLVTIWPSRLLIQDCDQISFHTDRSVRGLQHPRVKERALSSDGLFP
jgi:hypothetical protein